MRRFGIILFVIFQVQLVYLQASSTPSLLWKVSGKNLKEHSYIYGTIHIQDERAFFLETKILHYIEQCEAFAIEMLLDEVKPHDIERYMVMKNTSLQELLQPHNYQMLEEFFLQKTGQSLKFYNKIKPFFTATILLQNDLPKDRSLAMDLYLLNHARKLKKQVWGLETFQEQMKAVDRILLTEQAQMLVKTITEHQSNSFGIEDLLNAYISQDIEQIYNLSVQDTAMPHAFRKYFIEKRNVTMTKRIIRIAHKQTVFVAVGAAHLGGPKGIIALLQKKGYVVEPV